jgi:uncharacterized protein (TIGR02231 family)
MRHRHAIMARFPVLLLLFVPCFVGAPTTNAATDADAVHEVPSVVDKVVLYRGVASIERVVELDLKPGIHEVVFTGIPDPDGGLDFEGVQASADAPWQVLGVDSAIRPIVTTDAARKELEAAFLAASERLRRNQLEKEGVEEDLALLGMVGIRAASGASGDAGTASLDLDAVSAQFEFIRVRRTSLQKELLVIERSLAEAAEEVRRAEEAVDVADFSNEEIVARVRIAATTEGTARISIRYFRTSSDWDPAYSVREDQTSDTMMVEYAAVVVQGTGEDWSDIELTLSTAMPSQPSGPREITPVFVDRRSDPPPDRKSRANADVAIEQDSSGLFGSSGAALAEAMRNAQVTDGGTALTFRIPGRVSIPTDTMSQTRLRIAEFKAPTTRALVTRPVADPGVYLRADLVNDSEYVLLAGRAALFTAGEYLGATDIQEVAAGGDFEVWFGVDPSIEVTREVLGRETERTGLLGGGRRTTTDYRINLANRSGRNVAVEVWDRRPVSRNEDIDIQVLDVSPDFATDPEYLETAAVRGLLKWNIELTPTGTTGASKSMSWSTRVSRPKDLEITPIPE